METLATILPLLSRDMEAASIDLKDAYLHIPIHQTLRHFFAFWYCGIDYHFGDPGGASFLCRAGIKVFAYLDDWLVLGASEVDASANTTHVHMLKVASSGS